MIGRVNQGILLIVLIGAVWCGAPAGYAQSWTLIGTSSFTGDTTLMQDHGRFCANDIVIDPANNVYMTANRQNSGGDASGLTIVKPDTTVTHVNLSTAGYPGAVQKLVVAGDGKVYGVQNWLEIGWYFDSGVDSRILRINPDGSIDLIANTGNNGAGSTPIYRIEGLCVGGDGNVYWTKSGKHESVKYHFFYRYNVTTQTVEGPAGGGSRNDGWLEGDRFVNLTYVGNDWFAVVRSSDTSAYIWSTDAISWSGFRRVATNGTSNPTWGRDHCVALAWDPIDNILWMAPRGSLSRCILSRWLGNPSASYLFDDPVTDPATGIASNQAWHGDQDADLGGNRWVTDIETHPTTGEPWLAFAGVSAYNWSNRGHVVRYTSSPTLPLPLVDEGQPETGADVVGLHFCSNSTCLALTFNRTTGTYQAWRNGNLPAVVSVENWELY